MFIRSYDGSLVNLDHSSRILIVPGKDDTAVVVAKAPNGDYAHLTVGLTKVQADHYMKTLEQLLDARDVTLLAESWAEEVPA